MAAPGTNNPIIPLWILPLLLGLQLYTLEVCHAQWQPQQGGGFFPGSNQFFNNLNRGILPGGVKLSSLGGFPGGAPGTNQLNQQGSAGRSREIDCGMDPDQGPCNRLQVMYYYDQAQGRCNTFDYGGCLGNPNRYRSEKECLARCKPPANTNNKRAPGQGQGPPSPQNQGPPDNQGPPPVDNQGPPPGQGGESDLCSLPIAIGRCGSRLPRWYYDTQAGACREFLYSGCEGNSNNFRDERSCIDRCGSAHLNNQGTFDRRPPPPQDNIGGATNVCTLVPERGNCRGSVTRFYYDVNAGICRDFPYTGCGGNDNNFETIQHCQEACGRDQGPPPDQQGPPPRENGENVDLCTLPLETGPCRGRNVRYYYDTRLNRCTDFIYSGCDGNANNFETLEACERRCMPAPPPRDDQRPVDPRPVDPRPVDPRDPRPINPRPINPRPIDPRPIDPRPVDRPDERNKQPIPVDVCSLAPIQGPCNGKQERFYFDARVGQCQRFTFGGCQGNENNFQNIQACEQRCRPSRPVVQPTVTDPPRIPNMCFQAPAVGRCRSRLPRIYYDSRTATCRPFTFSGCQGNDNNFNDVATCEARCKPAPTPATGTTAREDDRRGMEDVCRLASVTGPCRARFPRYFYDNGKCKQFIYGGCGGNGNNFKDIKECEANCKRVDHDCVSPSDPGRCLALIRRFYYNRETRKCEAFVYGGCQGNANNYKTQQECEKACLPAEPQVAPAQEERLIDCPAPNGVAACVNMCKSNADCGDKQECCSNGCGRLCIRGATDKRP